MYYARHGQDLWVLETLGSKKDGYFVDIGASDGVVASNSHALEKLGWKGICVEANPYDRSFIKLCSNRKCICENLCVFSHSGEVEFLARGRRHEGSGVVGEFASPSILEQVNKKGHKTIKVKSITLLELLQKHKAPNIIDFLSIDTEGSELEILRDFDFSKYTFLTIAVENNFDETDPNGISKNKVRRDHIRKLLSKHGYILEKVIKFGEDWFIHKSIKKTTPKPEVLSHNMTYSFWDGTFLKSEPEKKYSISFCTTCMGRLYNLQDTLPINIQDNKDYANLEFVILDYNSNDNLGDWVQKNMMAEIESGRVSYYRTTEPKKFSMSHSRNIAFKVARGEIVNNLDADNFTRNPKHPTEESWASYLNRMANDQSERVIFAKGKSAMRGRIGFYKKEFIEELGGYDENLLGYGHDDHDLVNRAFGLGYKMYWWGGKYCSRIKTSRGEKNQNLARPWKVTEDENKAKSAANLMAGRFKANEDIHWGKARLIKNFKEELDV